VKKDSKVTPSGEVEMVLIKADGTRITNPQTRWGKIKILLYRLKRAIFSLSND
jgi:hypothetical protein